MGFPYFISYLPTLLLSAMYSIFMWRLCQRHMDCGVKERFQFFIWSMMYLVVMKGSFLIEYSTSPDEHQWIFSARAFAKNPGFWFQEYFPFEVGRSLTVIPLGIMAWIVGDLSFVHARILFIVLFGVNLVLMYAILRKRFTDRATIAALTWLVLLYCMTTYVDYASYNSEMPALFFIILSLWCLLKMRDDVTNFRLGFQVLFFSVCIPFAKEQALYLALFLWLCGAWLLVRHRHWMLILIYIAISVLSAGLLFSPLIYFGTVDVFLQNCLITLQYQSNGFGMAEKDLVNVFFIVHFLKLIFLNAMWFFPFLFLMFFLISWVRKNGFSLGKLQSNDAMDGMILLLTLVVLMTIYLPRNGIKHYCIFLIPVVVWSIARVYQRYHAKRWIAIGMWVLPFTIGIDANFRKEIFPVRGYRRPEEVFSKDVAFQGMKQHVPKGSKVMIWGWANHYYNLFDCVRCSHFLYPQFAYGFYEEKAFVDQCYIDDLRNLKPDYIVQSVGEKCFYFDDSLKYDMANHHPEIKKILNEDYSKIFHSGGVKIYRNRELE